MAAATGTETDRAARIELGPHALLAAAVRSWHAHAAAVTLHLLTTGVLLRCHLSIWKGAHHGRREQRQN